MKPINKTLSWLLILLVVIQTLFSLISAYAIFNIGVSMKYELGEPLLSKNPALHAAKEASFNDSLWFFYFWIFFAILSNSLLLFIINKSTSLNKNITKGVFYLLFIMQAIILLLTVWLLVS